MAVARQYRQGDVLVMRAESKLSHEEHAPSALPPGLYEVRRQRVYDPVSTPLARD